MFRLFLRYDISVLHSYFQPDFDAIEQNPSAQELLFRPVRARLSCRDVGKIDWNSMARGEFLGIAERVSRRYPVPKMPTVTKGESPKGHPCALELIAAPSKDCSILALAGPVVDETLIWLHRRSIDFVLEWMRQFFVTRRKDEQSFGVDLLRFPQFLNADQHPHLHDHLIFLWNASDENRGALHAYPIFFHLSAFQSLYHFALVALAKRLGYPVKLHGLRWDVGLNPGDVRAFSLIGETIQEIAKEWDDFESVGAAEHFASLGLRKIWPSLGRIRLEAARQNWNRIVPAERCVASKIRFPREVFPEVIEMTPYFAASAVTTKTLLMGRILNSWRGKIHGVSSTFRRIHSAIDAEVASGNLVASTQNSVCHPGLFKVEQEILNIIKEGIGNGNPCKIVIPEDPFSSRRLASAARRPDRVRIISQEGRELEEDATLDFLGDHSSGEPPLLARFETWNALDVLRLLRKNPARDVLVVVRESSHAGDFVSLASRIASLPAEESLAHASQLLLDGKPLEVVEEQLTREVGGRFRLLERSSREELRVVVVPENYPEDIRLAWNDLLSRQLFGLLAGLDDESVLFYFDEVIPWNRVGDTFDWTSHSLFCLSSNALFRHGTRWSVVEFTSDTLKLKAIRRGKTVSIAQVLEVKDTTALVRPSITRLTAGAQLECLLDFKKDGLRLRNGEVVLVSKVLADKSIALDDGRVVPSVYRAFRPAFLIRQVIRSSRPPDVVVVAAPPTSKILDQLRHFEFWRKMILLAENSKKLRELIASEIANELKKKKNTQIERLLDEPKVGDVVTHGVLPSRSSWPLMDTEFDIDALCESEVSLNTDDENDEQIDVLLTVEGKEDVEAFAPVPQPVIASDPNAILLDDLSQETETSIAPDIEQASENDQRTTEEEIVDTSVIETSLVQPEQMANDFGAEVSPSPQEAVEVDTSLLETLAIQPVSNKKAEEQDEDESEKLAGPDEAEVTGPHQPADEAAKPKKRKAKGKNSRSGPTMT